MKLRLSAMVGGLMLLTTASLALPPMLKTFETTYTPSKNGRLAKARCVVCHVATGKSTLNPYGKDIKEALKGSKDLTPANLKAIEAKDSDQDGVSNADEIKGDSLPGDKTSKPAKK